MGLTQVVADRAKIPVHRAGSLELVAFEDTPRLLEAIRRLGWRVLGIEGFRIENGCTVPVMSAIADWSDLIESEVADRSIQESSRFIESVGGPGMLFDFVLEAPNH